MLNTPTEPSLTRGLSIIVVTYGSANTVRECLRSVRTVTAGIDNVRVFVCDNASLDDTPDMVAREYPEVTLIRSPTNDGFAVANNRALGRVKTDVALLLNPDCVLQPGELEPLLDKLRADPSIGVLGCRLITADGDFDHAAKRQIPRLRDAVLHFLGRSDSRYRAPHVPERGEGAVDAVNGAFMLVSTRAVAHVGGLDERYWMYAEDLDWCLRFREGGWQVYYDGTHTCIHLKSAITGRRRSAKLNWHFHRSMAIFYRAHLRVNPVADALIVSAIYMRMAIKIIVDSTVRATHGRTGQRRPTRSGADA